MQRSGKKKITGGSAGQIDKITSPRGGRRRRPGRSAQPVAGTGSAGEKHEPGTKESGRRSDAARDAERGPCGEGPGRVGGSRACGLLCIRPF